MGVLKKKEPIKFTEQSIRKRLQLQAHSNPQYYMHNLYVFGWESDFLVKTRSNYWYEYEIKISVADFKKDFIKEEKHYKLMTGNKLYNISHFKTINNVRIQTSSYYSNPALIPNYFSYVVPYTILDKIKDIIPTYAGLYYISESNNLECYKKPPKLHSNKINDCKLNLQEKFYYAFKNYENRCENNTMGKELQHCKDMINFLKTEYKAATGNDINEIF